MFGFGAKVPPYLMKPSYCFAVNGDYFDPECDGIDGVIEAYKHAVTRVQLHGPTYFKHVI